MKWQIGKPFSNDTRTVSHQIFILSFTLEGVNVNQEGNMSSILYINLLYRTINCSATFQCPLCLLCPYAVMLNILSK